MAADPNYECNAIIICSKNTASQNCYPNHSGNDTLSFQNIFFLLKENWIVTPFPLHHHNGTLVGYLFQFSRWHSLLCCCENKYPFATLEVFCIPYTELYFPILGKALTKLKLIQVLFTKVFFQHLTMDNLGSHFVKPYQDVL